MIGWCTGGTYAPATGFREHSDNEWTRLVIGLLFFGFLSLSIKAYFTGVSYWCSLPSNRFRKTLWQWCKNTVGKQEIQIYLSVKLPWHFCLFRSARTSWDTFVRPSANLPVGKKNLDQLYSSALYMLHRPIWPYIFRKLMTHTIHWCPHDDNDMQRQRQNYYKIWNNIWHVFALQLKVIHATLICNLFRS